MYYHGINTQSEHQSQTLGNKTSAVFLQTVHINVGIIKPPTMHSYANTVYT
jgi:hypothetical protein